MDLINFRGSETASATPQLTQSGVARDTDRDHVVRLDSITNVCKSATGSGFKY